MNLNIDKFSKNDLLDIFNIPQDEEISYNFIENKCQKYISRVTTDQRLSIEKKQNLYQQAFYERRMFSLGLSVSPKTLLSSLMESLRSQ